jgi:integrase
MASTYLRKNSPFIWMRQKTAEGKWIGKATCYRKDNIGDRRQAKLLAARLSIDERERTPASVREHWDEWVDAWMQSRYGQRQATTLTVYRRYWKRLRAWLLAESIVAPAQLSYLGALRYKEAREEDEVGINTIIHELKFLGVVMGEAVRRGFAPANPCRAMGLQRTPAAEKHPWKPAEAAKVAAAIGAQPDWMQASFILGYYQAARLRQCEVPLQDIDLARRRITYWKSITGRPLTKGDKPFTQPLATAALPMLEALMARRRAAGALALCEIPVLPSVEWRRFLDSLGLSHLSHHGLRVTWITRAAESGSISQAQAMRFVNHGSTAVHAIYQRLNADDVAHVADALGLSDLSR